MVRNTLPPTTHDLSPFTIMPTYEFRCPNGHEFEQFYRTITGAPTELPCPECGALATRKLSGGAGLLFKGSGFYLTDYGKNAHRKTEPSKKDDTGSGKKESAGSESKAESPKPDVAKSESAKPKTEPPKPKSE